MKKLLTIVFLVIAFSCQDSANDLQSNRSEVTVKNHELIVKSFDELQIDPGLATKYSLSEREFQQRLESIEQLMLILNDLAEEMPESLKNSDDWVSVMKRDPAAAEFGEKLKAKVDELPPVFRPGCDLWEQLMAVFNCLWANMKICREVGAWECLKGIVQLVEAALSCYAFC